MNKNNANSLLNWIILTEIILGFFFLACLITNRGFLWGNNYLYKPIYTNYISSEFDNCFWVTSNSDENGEEGGYLIGCNPKDYYAIFNCVSQFSSPWEKFHNYDSTSSHHKIIGSCITKEDPFQKSYRCYSFPPILTSRHHNDIFKVKRIGDYYEIYKMDKKYIKIKLLNHKKATWVYIGDEWHNTLPYISNDS